MNNIYFHTPSSSTSKDTSSTTLRTLNRSRILVQIYNHKVIVSSLLLLIVTTAGVFALVPPGKTPKHNIESNNTADNSITSKEQATIHAKSENNSQSVDGEVTINSQPGASKTTANEPTVSGSITVNGKTTPITSSQTSVSTPLNSDENHVDIHIESNGTGSSSNYSSTYSSSQNATSFQSQTNISTNSESTY